MAPPPEEPEIRFPVEATVHWKVALAGHNSNPKGITGTVVGHFTGFEGTPCVRIKHPQGVLEALVSDITIVRLPLSRLTKKTTTPDPE